MNSHTSLLYREETVVAPRIINPWMPQVVADGAFFASIPQKTTVYVLRHGQSEGNATGTFQGKLDFPLDSRGREQASATAAWLSSQGLETVVASPQKRAAETATIIASACGLDKVVFLDSLVEVDVGLFGGLSWESSQARHPEVFSEFQYKSWDAVPGAETSERMYARAIQSWEGIRRLAEKGIGTIGCVSHGGLIQWLIRSTFGARSWLPLIPTSNCGISKFEIEPTPAGKGAFIQWTMINFKAPGLGQGAKPVF